jgi:hypothetical protein
LARELDAADEHAAALASAHEAAAAADDEHAAALAAANEAAAAAQREIADLRVERRRLEARNGTLERAYADVEADRIADREAADRWLSITILSRDALRARLRELERERDETAWRPERVADELAEAQQLLRTERETSERAYRRLRETVEERDALAARVDELQGRLGELEERQRVQGAAAIRQLHSTLEAQRVASDRRVEEIRRDAELRIAAAESSTLDSILGVHDLDLDGLAEVYATARRERSRAERRGKFDFAQRWDALARRMVDEIDSRPDPVATGIEKLRVGRARVGRFVRGRSARARAQLVADALERGN